jgi:hypothetical protein
MIPITLSVMDKEQKSYFIDQIVIFFKSEGIDVPYPDTKKALEMFQYYKEKGIL